MGVRRARAFAPAHITGFFVPHRVDDPLRSGSYGAGIAVDLGAHADVEMDDSGEIRISMPFGRADVTERAVKLALRETGSNMGVRADLALQLPIGQGFGMSGAGTLAVTMALAELLGKSGEDALRWAHTAEIVSGTGLSDVIGSYYGGLVIRKKPGLPPYGEIERMEADAEIRCMIIGEPISTKEFLASADESAIRKAGMASLKRLEEKPSLKTFMIESRRFAESLDLSPELLRRIPEGFHGSQVMLGNSIFFTDLRNSTAVKLVKGPEAPPNSLRCSPDNLGARIIG